MQLFCGLERAYEFLNRMSVDDAHGGIKHKSKTKQRNSFKDRQGAQVAILSFGGRNDCDEKERLQEGTP